MIFQQSRFLRFFRLTVFLFFSFFTLLSCANADEVLRKNLINLATEKKFSEIEKLSNSKLKKVVALQDATLYCLALVLEDNDRVEQAKKFLLYGYDNYKNAYSSLCEKRYLSIAETTEAILFLEKKYSKLQKEKAKLEKVKKNRDENTIQELDNSLKEITTSLDELYLLEGMLDKISIPYQSYLNNLDISQATSVSLLDYIAQNENSSLFKDNQFFFRVLKARSLCKAKNYNESATLVSSLINDISSKNKTFDLTRFIVSDFGRALLNGNKNYSESIELLHTLKDYATTNVQEENKQTVLHALYFYLARISEKRGSSFNDETLEYYRLSVSNSPSNWDYDNVLWYELSFLRSYDEERYLKRIEETISTWKDDYWYEDLISALTLKYTQAKNVSKLKDLQRIINGSNLKEAKAKLSYTIGRLTDSFSELYRTYKMEQNTWYYTLLSAYFVGEEAIFKFVNQYARKSSFDFEYDDGISLLESLSIFELFDKIYSHMQLVIPTISVLDAEKFSTLLYEKDYIADSMNFIQYANRSKGASFTDNALKLLYPRPFYQSVKKYASYYNIPEYFLYALMRCESFFKPAVISHAGAVGLTQLMPSTAAEIARGFKLTEYDITEPDTNIRFGSYYIAQMFKVQGKNVKAFQAYNAGGGRVNTWNRTYKNVSLDVFVEMTPFDETRNYGKNILQAACIYAKLYYGKDYNSVIEEFFEFTK